MRRLARVFGNGPAAGALFFVALFLGDVFGLRLEFMGYSDARAVDMLLARYGRQVAWDQARILAILVGLGLLFGALGALWGRARDATLRRNASRARSFVRGLVAAGLLHGWFLVRDLVAYPQLYSEWLFDRGGWRRRAMRALSDHLTPTRWSLIGALALLLALLPLALAPRTHVFARARLRAARAWLAARAHGLQRSRRQRVVAGVLLALAVAPLAWQVWPRRVLRPKTPHVLIIAVDSLRADRVFDGRFATLRALATRGVRFREAHITVPRTFPSFVTLLTGRYPHHHGIRHMFPTSETRQNIGSSLPAAFGAAGYHTAVVSDYAGEIFSRTPLGFDDVRVPHFDMRTIFEQRAVAMHPHAMPYLTRAPLAALFPSVEAMPERSDPERLTARALEAFEACAAKPCFDVVFYSTAHFPYASPWPFYRRFADAAYDGPFRFQKPPLAEVAPGDVAQVRALYDGAVAAVDAAVGHLLDGLARARLLDDTIVVLLADHGEHLYESLERGMGHGDHLRGDAADHVPLVIVDPRHGFAAHDVTGIVRDVDVAPTLAALAGVTSPGVDGVDLGPLLRGDKDTLGLDAFSETEFWLTSGAPGAGEDERLPYPGVIGATEVAPDDDITLRPEWEETVVVGKHRAIRTPAWKLIYQPTRAGVRWRLEPAGGGDDVAAAHPDVVAALRARLDAWMASDGHTVLRGGFAVPR